MARIRTIKPEFFTSEDIVSLSPLARLLYIAMWCEADKEGRLVWKPATFKLRYMPGDNCKIDSLCSEILDRGLVVMYGDGLAYIPSFLDHQHINPRESDSKLPIPDASTTRAPRVSTCANLDMHPQVGREGKGKEGKGKDIATSVATPDGVCDSVWQDFQKIRKAKKAPITETAIDGIRREAEKAGVSLETALKTCCERGWTGFNAEWVAAKPNPADIARITVPGPTGRDPALVKADEDAKRAAPIPQHIREQLSKIRSFQVAA